MDKPPFNPVSDLCPANSTWTMCNARGAKPPFLIALTSLLTTVALTREQESFAQTTSRCLQNGVVGVLGAVAAVRAIQGRNADPESASRLHMAEARQSAKAGTRNLNREIVTPTNALWMQLGRNGALGAVVARLVEQGPRAELESATRPQMVEAHQFAQAQRQNRETALMRHALKS